MTDVSAQSINNLVSLIPCNEWPGNDTVFRPELYEADHDNQHLVTAASGRRGVTKSAVSFPPFSVPYTDLQAAIVPIL
jgi:hypothetical protein